MTAGHRADGTELGLRSSGDSPHGSRRIDALTEREREVLRLLMLGKSNTAIAHTLGISPNTVRTHVGRIFAKLGVHTRVDAASVGFSRGLEPLSTSSASVAADSGAGSTVVRILQVGEGILRSRSLQKELTVQEKLLQVPRAPDVDGTLAAIETHCPDVVVLEDLDPSAPRAFEVCLAVKQRADVPRVLVVADDDAATLFGAFMAGADGYATPALAAEQIIDGIRRLHAGQLFAPPHMLEGLVRTLVARTREMQNVSKRFVRLTAREYEVLQLLVRGCDRQAVAVRLAVSPETARTHIQHVLDKLEVGSKLEAAALAVRVGLTEHSAAEGMRV